MIEIPPFEIHSVVTGKMRLDGGAMFGIVPKVMWEKSSDVDELNRIAMTTRTLLAIDRDANRVILVDTGCGSKWSPKMAQRYGLQIDHQAIPNALGELGLSTKDVTDIVVTHLHFDHNGGLTQWYDQPDDKTTLCFPSAMHWVHRRHFEHANSPHTKDKASYIPADFNDLAQATNVTFLDGEHPTSPIEGLSWWVSHGHTPYQLHPIFGNKKQQLIFCGDIIPTIAHLRLPWVMAYDMKPITTIAEKEWINQQGIKEGWLLAFPHDPEHGGVIIDGKATRPVVAQSLDL